MFFSLCLLCVFQFLILFFPLQSLKPNLRTLVFVMGMFALRTVERIQEFDREFIPDGTNWRKCQSNEDPFEDVSIAEGTYPIITYFFRQVGLRLPLDTLLVTFFRNSRFHLDQLTPNTIRLVLGVVELNKHFNLSLGLDEIKYCYDLNRCERK